MPQLRLILSERKLKIAGELLPAIFNFSGTKLFVAFALVRIKESLTKADTLWCYFEKFIVF